MDMYCRDYPLDMIQLAALKLVAKDIKAKVAPNCP